jgi:hypothetical protein
VGKPATDHHTAVPPISAGFVAVEGAASVSQTGMGNPYYSKKGAEFVNQQTLTDKDREMAQTCVNCRLCSRDAQQLIDCR